MPITVEIQDENGKLVAGPVYWQVPPFDLFNGESRFSCLQFVDPYGDTTFNVLQLPAFMDDLRRLRESFRLNEGQVAEVLILEALIEPYLEKPHHYVKLIGD